MRRHTWLIALAVVLLPSLARAQAPTAYIVAVSSGVSAISTATIPAALFACNQARRPILTVNPQYIQLDDPVNNPTGSPTGPVCLYGPDSPTGPLNSLPIGQAGYTVTVQVVTAVQTSPPSAPSPIFTHPGVAAPTGVAAIQ